MGLQTLVAGILLPAILIYAGIIDVRTRTVSNKVCFFVALCSLLHFDVWNLFGLIPVFFTLAIAIKTNEMGGGDIKFLAALALSLGFEGMLVVLFCASLLMLIFYLGLRIIKGKSAPKSFPFIPFIALGYFINLLLS